MTKTILLALTLLSCTAWMAAQSTPSTPSSQDPARASPSSSGQASQGASQSAGGAETTIQGCLSGSAGSFQLTDASGTKYDLQGDTSKLSSWVNNEVQVKGTAGSGSASSGAAPGSQSAGTPTSAGGGQTFNVTKAKKVSGSCSSAK